MSPRPRTPAAMPRPIHLLAGDPGGRRDAYAPVVAEILRSAGKPKPLLGYLGAATDDDPRFLGWMKGLVTSAGPCDFQLAPVKGRRATGSAARRIIEAADVVFVGGGDVDLGMQRLLERDLAGALRARLAAGTPIFGISAGAIMLCRSWIRWRDPDDDGSAELFDCLGLAPVLCDCHGEDDGWGELQALLRLAGDGSLGHGLRAGSAARVAADGSTEPILGKVDRFRARQGEVATL
jgi:cyanophycinase-like exopeptidase